MALLTRVPIGQRRVSVTINRPDLIAPLVLVLVVALFFGRVLFGGRVLLPADNLVLTLPWRSFAGQLGIGVPHNHLLGDMLFQNFAWKQFARETLARGELPLWNPYVFGGEPFLAAGQQGVLYPLGALFYLLPPAQAYGWFTALHVLMAGLGMYLLLRVLKSPPFGALIAGLTFMLAGYFIVSFIWPMVVGVVVWTPWLLAVIEVVVGRVEERRFPLAPLLGGAVLIALQILAGHLEYSFYLLFVLGWYSLWRLGFLLWRTRALRTTIALGAALLAMVGLGIGLAAVQLVPFFELAGANYRVGLVSYQDVVGWALPKARLLTFLVPNLFGNPAQHAYLDPITWRVTDLARFIEVDPGRYKNYVEGAAYVGVLPLLFAIVAALGGRRRPVAIFGGLAIVSLLLALGTPLYGLLWHLPGFDQLHTPFRWVFPYSLAAAVLAGLGAGELVRPDRHYHAGRAATLVGLAAAAGGAALVAALAISRLRLDSTLAWLDSWRTRNEAFAAAFRDVTLLYGFEFGHVALFGVLLLLGGTVLFLLPRRPRVAAALAVALVAGDLLLFGHDFNTTADPSLLDARPPALAALPRTAEPYRIVSFGPGDILKPNSAMLVGVQDARGYDSIILKRYTEFWGVIEPPSGLLYNEINRLTRPESLASPLLDLLNVRYVLTTERIDRPGYREVYAGELRIYEREGALPRAFVVHEAIVRAPGDSTLATLGSPTFDPRRSVVVDRAPGIAPTRLGGTDQVQITHYSANEIEVVADLTSPGLLVLTDNYFPGWQVMVDGQPGDLLRANHTFRAVAVPDGSHRILFRYRPNSFFAGLYVSLIAVAVLLLGLGYAAWGRCAGLLNPTSTVGRVFKNSATPIATQLLNRTLDFAFAIFMLRVLGVENAGKYALAVVLFGYFAIFTEFGLGTLLTREVARDRTAAARYLGNTIALRLLLVLASAPLLLAVVGLYSWQFGLTADTALAALLLGIGLVPSALSAAFSSVFNAFERMERPAAITLVTNLLKIVLGTAALLLGWGIVGLAAVAIVVSTITAGIFYVLLRREFFAPRWELDLAFARSMLREAYPLMINNFLATIFFRIDVLLLQPMKGDAANGIYSTAYKFIDGFGIIPSVFTLAIFPVIARYADSARDSLVRSYCLALKALLIVSLPIVVGTVLLADTIILLFFGEQFAPAVGALQVLILFLPFSFVNGLTQYVLIAVGQQRFLTIAFVVGAAFNVASNFLLIPAWSYMGAATTTVLSELVLMVPFLYAVRRHVGDVTPWTIVGLAARPAAASVLMGAVVWRLHDLPLVVPVLLGAAVYLVALVALRTFGAEERAVLERLLIRRA